MTRDNIVLKNKITQLTRNDIFGILDIGIELTGDEIIELPFDNFDTKKTARITYHGKMDEVTFLKRLYKLEEMESFDRRYSNAEGDIYQHRINNYDWDDNWIFTDPRFELYHDDVKLLDFLAEVFNPFVRKESEPWKKIFDIINELLKEDGFELYEKSHISNRPVYSWRETGKDVIVLNTENTANNAKLKLVGEGSYAHVFRYKDDYYDSDFILKRAKKDLNSKEIKRFRIEFETMKSLNSPYIVKVYKYNNDNSYIMESMDLTLEKYIDANNGKLTYYDRLNICKQIFKGFEYISNKSLLHRDISHKNILVKMHEDGTNVFKLSDFGLVKIPDSDLTSFDTEYKGFFNDPILKIEGFSTYNELHEIYALTILLIFVMTGKTNISNIKEQNFKEFLLKGTNPNLKERISSVNDLKNEFDNLIVKQEI